MRVIILGYSVVIQIEDKKEQKPDEENNK